jgi:hypothetical protein
VELHSLPVSSTALLGFLSYFLLTENDAFRNVSVLLRSRFLNLSPSVPFHSSLVRGLRFHKLLRAFAVSPRKPRSRLSLSNFDFFEFAILRLCPGISCLQSYRRHIISLLNCIRCGLLCRCIWTISYTELLDFLSFSQRNTMIPENVFALLRSQFLDSSPQSRPCGYNKELYLCPRIRNFEALCLVIVVSSYCHTRSTQFHSM